MSSDKRRHPRIPANEETIYYSLLEGNPGIKRMHYIGTITNVSDMGVGVKVIIDHEPGEEIYFESVGGNNGARQGVVKWLREPSIGDWYEMGVEFIS